MRFVTALRGSRRSVRRNRTLLFFLLVLVTSLAGIDRIAAIVAGRGALRTDFRSFYVACRAANWGADVYDVESLNRIAQESDIQGYVAPYLYPPFFAYVASPMGTLAPQTAQLLWTIGSILLFALAGVLAVELATAHLRREGGDERPGPAVASALLLPLLLPIRNNIGMGQINVLVLAFLSLSLLGIARRRDAIAGVCLSVAALIKFTPFLLLGLFLARRRYRAAVACCVSTLFLIGGTMILGGTGAWRRYLELLPQMSHGSTIPGLFGAGRTANFSLAGLASRLAPADPSLVRIAVWVTVAGLLAVLVFYARRARDGTTAGLALLPFLVLMIIASPLAYLHHVVYLYPGAVLTLSILWMRSDPGEGKRYLPVLIGAIVVASFNWPVVYPRGSGLLYRFATSLNLDALLVLYAVPLGLLRARVRMDAARVASESMALRG